MEGCQVTLQGDIDPRAHQPRHIVSQSSEVNSHDLWKEYHNLSGKSNQPMRLAQKPLLLFDNLIFS